MMNGIRPFLTVENRMGTATIRLDSELVERAASVGEIYGRSTAKQIEHWAKIGEMMEGNPELSYEFVQQTIISKTEKEVEKLEGYQFG